MPKSNHESAKLQAAANEIVESAGYFLEELSVREAGRRLLIRITVDAPRAIDLDEIAGISRKIDRAIEEQDLLDDAAYTLEVSSRGTDRPLTLLRHFQANVDRLLEVELNSGEAMKSRLLQVEGEELVFENERVPFANVKNAKVVLEFNRKGAVVEEFDVESEVDEDFEDGDFEDGAEDAE